jgi:hypothetical protein
LRSKDSEQFCKKCIEWDDISVGTQCTINSGYNSEAERGECVCSGWHEHYIQYCSSTSSKIIPINRELQLNIIDDRERFYCCYCEEMTDSYFDADFEVFVCEGCLTEERTYIHNSLCDICLGSVSFRHRVIIPRCECVMHLSCFERVVARKSSLISCPSRAHIKCQTCFWCDY